MGLFSKLFQNKVNRTKEGVKLVYHLQRLLAYQQLTMERMNDALAVVSKSPTPRFEGLLRPTMSVTDESAIRKVLLPQLVEKLSIIDKMVAEHHRLSLPSEEISERAYIAFEDFLDVMRCRAELQHAGYTLFVESEVTDIDLTSLDEAEKKAMDTALSALNALIAEQGLVSDLMEINCTVFNEVRTSVGLRALNLEDFSVRYFGGMIGRKARFFSD